MNDLKICFTPSSEDMKYIGEWLYKEYSASGKGFYCNLNVVYNAFKRHSLATISKSTNCIGFITWYETTNYTASINITEIHPDFRRNGYGNILANSLIDYLRVKGIAVITLECMPHSSESFWKIIGFTEFNHHFFVKDNKELYLITKPTLLPVNNKISNGELIELWACEPYLAANKDAYWHWHPELNESMELTTALIFPALNDWRIRWTSNGKILKDSKVKYFDSDIDFDRFIIITKMPKTSYNDV